MLMVLICMARADAATVICIGLCPMGVYMYGEWAGRLAVVVLCG